MRHGGYLPQLTTPRPIAATHAQKSCSILHACAPVRQQSDEPVAVAVAVRAVAGRAQPRGAAAAPLLVALRVAAVGGRAALPPAAASPDHIDRDGDSKTTRSDEAENKEKYAEKDVMTETEVADRNTGA